MTIETLAPSEPPPTEKRCDARAGRRIVAASRIGKSHEAAGTFREDAFSVLNRLDEGWFAVAVADGLGSCALSRTGAALATSAATTYLARYPVPYMKLDPESVVRLAAARARRVIEIRAQETGRPVREYSCTLLLVVGVAQEKGWCVATFQAGDGLIAEAGWEGRIQELGAADAFAYSGEVHPLTGSEVARTWRTRSHVHTFARPPGAILVMSDGVADDLIPISANGPILMGEIAKALAQPAPEDALLDLLAYEKKGSFDDRTLVVVPLSPAVEDVTPPTRPASQDGPA